jgi:transcription elongation factor B subunit 1
MDKPTEYVTLVSNDGYEFKILRSAACIAGTIKKALDPTCSSFTLNAMRITNSYPAGFRENTQNRVDLPTIKYDVSTARRTRTMSRIHAYCIQWCCT